jgi:L-alanine-DL-glutamate epimerase-like enolase superfamily enzyme
MTSMKIAAITVTVFGHTVGREDDIEGHAHPASPRQGQTALLTIEADEAQGLALAPVEAVRPYVMDRWVRPRLLGEDPLRIAMLWHRLYRLQRGSGGMLAERTLSAVEAALWDLVGKVAGQPVWKLLGGDRDRVPAYASTMCGDDLPGGLGSPEDYGAFARTLVARGYKAIKLHSWMPPVVAVPDPRRDLAACAAVREAAGPDIALMLDSYHWYARDQALWLGRGLEELGFAWFEEPMDEYSISSYAWLADQLDIPIIGPETAFGKHRTRAEWIRAGACDILRTGVHDVGGILPAIKVAHLAEAFGMNAEVHGGGAENLAVLGAIRNSTWYERGLLHPFLDHDRPPDYLRRPIDPMDGQGMVDLPQAPGLGLDLDLDYVRAHTQSIDQGKTD